MAVTANLLVRRAAFAEVGGFAEGTRSGADAELCWRLQDAGWGLELRERALVHHEHRADLRALLVQSARDGAGGRWLARRHPGFAPHAPLGRELARAVAGGLAWLLRGRPQRALFKLIDGVHTIAGWAGSLQSNGAPLERPPGAPVAFVEEFPGAPVADGAAVEALRRPATGDWSRARGHAGWWAEDEGAAVRARALLRLAARRPAAARAVVRERGLRAAAALAPAAARLDRASVVSADEKRAADAAAAARLAGVER